MPAPGERLREVGDERLGATGLGRAEGGDERGDDG